VQTELSSLFSLLRPAMDRIDAQMASGQGVVGVPSGFYDLDRLTSGFKAADLIIVAGRPAMGKTSFVLNLALHAAVNTACPVAIFSLEMSKEQLVRASPLPAGQDRLAAPSQGPARRCRVRAAGDGHRSAGERPNLYRRLADPGRADPSPQGEAGEGQARAGTGAARLPAANAGKKPGRRTTTAFRRSLRSPDH